VTGPAIFGPSYGRTLIKRDPRPDEERAIRDLLRAMTGATLDIARERRAEEQQRERAG
jgi:hypothetical protein